DRESEAAMPPAASKEPFTVDYPSADASRPNEEEPPSAPGPDPLPRFDTRFRISRAAASGSLRECYTRLARAGRRLYQFATAEPPFLAPDCVEEVRRGYQGDPAPVAPPGLRE